MGFVNAINTLNNNAIEHVPAFWVNNPQIHDAAFQPIPTDEAPTDEAPTEEAPAIDADTPAVKPVKTARPKKAGPVKNSDAIAVPDAATQEGPNPGASNSEENPSCA